MANVKISDLTAASAVADSNQLEINESGTSKRVTAAQLKTYATSDTVSASSGGTFSGNVIVDGSNKLGVGTSSPDLKLDVSHGTTAEYVATFQNTADNLELKIGTTTNGLLNIQGANASNNSAYDFSLNADGGKVLVGKTSTSFSTAGHRLDDDGNVEHVRSGAAPMHLNRKSDDGEIAIFYKDGNDKGDIRNNGNDFIFKARSSVGKAEIQTHDGNEKIALDPSGYIKFEAAGSERMRLRSDGYLDVAGASDIRLTLGSQGTAGNNDANWVRGRGDDLMFNNGGGFTSWESNGAEQMRLDASGNLLVGGSSFGYDGSQDCVQINQSEGRIDIENNTTGTVYNLSFYNPNGNVGKISTSSSSTNYSTSSDYRLKENVAGITDGIARVKQLAPKRFNFITDPDNTVDGFLAHEAQAVVPESVTGTHNEVEVWSEGEELPDGVSVGDNKLNDKGETIPVMQGIDQSKIVPLLCAALREAIVKIETLETKVAALEAE